MRDVYKRQVQYLVHLLYLVVPVRTPFLQRVYQSLFPAAVSYTHLQIVEASRAGLEQIRQVSVSDILWHTLQYFTWV